MSYPKSTTKFIKDYEIPKVQVLIKRSHFKCLPQDLQEFILDHGSTSFTADPDFIKSANMEPDEVAISLNQLSKGTTSQTLAIFRVLLFDHGNVRYYPPLER